MSDPWQAVDESRAYLADLYEFESMRLEGTEPTVKRLSLSSVEWSRLRSAVFERDEFTCSYCGSIGVRLECDHVMPVSRGGSDEMSNLVTACFSCNRRKGARTAEEWLS